MNSRVKTIAYIVGVVLFICVVFYLIKVDREGDANRILQLKKEQAEKDSIATEIQKQDSIILASLPPKKREKLLAQREAERKEALISPSERNSNALREIKKEPKVVEAIITDADVLYVSVFDNGQRRDGFADYLCQILKENKSTISLIRITKAGSVNDPNRDNAYGIWLGESRCN